MLSNYFFSEDYWDLAKSLIDGNQFALKIKTKSSNFFTTPNVDVVYFLNTLSVNIENVIQISNEMQFSDKSKVHANWIIVGSGSGIYLFEELSLKKYRKVGKWRNAFCTIDTDTGKTFYDLKSEDNLSLSKEMEDLIRNSNMYSKEAFSKKLSNIRRKIFDNMKY